MSQSKNFCIKKYLISFAAKIIAWDILLHMRIKNYLEEENITCNEIYQSGMNIICGRRIILLNYYLRE